MNSEKEKECPPQSSPHKFYSINTQKIQKGSKRVENLGAEVEVRQQLLDSPQIIFICILICILININQLAVASGQLLMADLHIIVQYSQLLNLIKC